MLFTVTTTGPGTPPVGTEATICPVFQLDAVAVFPLNVIVLEPWGDPKPLPVIVTTVPTPPDVGERLVMPGAVVMVNVTPLLAIPLTVTTTLPVVAPVGTEVTIEVPLQVWTVAAVPLNLTVPLPWVEPKFVPVIVTVAPMPPDVGDRLEIVGANTVNVTPLLATPFTVTTTGPVVTLAGAFATICVADQVDTDAVKPLNVTELLPCIAPKFVPLIETCVSVEPEVGERFVMFGTVNTVNPTALLATPPTVTMRFPLVAPEGTGTTI
jgi:hypothetical protein